MKLKSLLLVFTVLGLAFSLGCSTYEQKIQTEIVPEPQLYQMAIDKMNNKKYVDAISTFERYMRLYISNPRIQEVRLKLADSYFQQGSFMSMFTAKAKYTEFLTLYPNYEQADYIWLQIAKCDQARMLPSNRDQSATKEAIVDIKEFITNHPDSQYLPEAREMLSEAESVLADYNFKIGEHYYNRNIHISSPARFLEAINLDPQFPKREKLLRMLVISSAKSADTYSKMYTFSQKNGRKQMADTEFGEYEKNTYNANKYFAIYEEEFSGNSKQIKLMRSEINQITKAEKVEEPEETEKIEETEEQDNQ